MEFYKQENIIDKLDRKTLIEKLYLYYETEDMDQIFEKLKDDLKDKEKVENLIEYTSFELRELLVYLNSIFDSLFTKKLIKKIKSEVIS